MEVWCRLVIPIKLNANSRQSKIPIMLYPTTQDETYLSAFSFECVRVSDNYHTVDDKSKVVLNKH